MNKILPVILCGGTGSRLWPVSREMHPKPFIAMKDGQTLLQKAFLRAASFRDVDEILTITNENIFFKVEDEFLAVNNRRLKTRFILEPSARNTAAAISMAALSAGKSYGPNTILLVLPADHLILQTDAFHAAVKAAIGLACQSKLVTFGIRPTRPDTGYGYIEAEENVVIRFIEKPPLAKAEKYIASNRFFWNSGMFCFTAGMILNEMKKHCPDIVTASRHCMHVSRKTMRGDMAPLTLDAKSFASVPSESIDYAVMEKSVNSAVVPCDIGWYDIGSWDALKALSEVDSDGNCVKGAALMEDTRNCYIQSHDRLVGTVNVEDLIVVDTPDALLIANRHSAQRVRHLYTRLKAEGHEAHKLHRTVDRPWGTYTILEESVGFKVKRIEIKPKASLSLQTHQHRNEHWVVVQGNAWVVNGDKSFTLHTGESTYIPAGYRHRISNPEDSLLVIVEVQCGDYLGEDDIVRLEDVYGRV